MRISVDWTRCLVARAPEAAAKAARIAAVVAAAVYAGVPFNPNRCKLMLQGKRVFASGKPASFRPSAVSQALAAPEVRIDLDCGAAPGQATVWICDLSK